MNVNRPRFLVIGAQKSATSWLWEGVLKPHPETSLGQKEIHFFGGAENFRRGRDWYYRHFANLDGSKLIGEASTSYFYDRVPFWYNRSRRIELDPDLPPLPELVTSELGDVKVILMLRDPVARAVSAYKHNIRKWSRLNVGDRPPFAGLAQTATEEPKARLLEYGFYDRHLAMWRKYIPPERLRIYIFEEDVLRKPEEMATDVYRFLGLDPDFKPTQLRMAVHRSMGLTRAWLGYHGGPTLRRIIGSRLFRVLDRPELDVMARYCIKPSDIRFLRSKYRPRHRRLEALVGRSIDCWSYGGSLMDRKKVARETGRDLAPGA